MEILKKKMVIINQKPINEVTNEECDEVEKIEELLDILRKKRSFFQHKEAKKIK